MKLIESYHSNVNGYTPFLITEKWQIAQLNYNDVNRFFNVHRLDVHHYTDESFILIKGTVVLIAAQIDVNGITFDLSLLETGVVYNIPTNCWHNLMMSEDAEVIIVENASTHLSDFEYYNLDKLQEQQLNAEVKSLLKVHGKYE